MIEGQRCERCDGRGYVDDLSSSGRFTCPVCLSLGSFVPLPVRPPNEHHLIALHSTALQWDEVVAMLPLVEPKEDWDE